MKISARTSLIVAMSVLLLACFEITGIDGPQDVELGEIVEYVVSFRADEDSAPEGWTGEIWWDLPRGWTFLSGEYEGVANGVPFAGVLTPNPLTFDIWAGCFNTTLTYGWHYRGSASTELEPPVVAGDTGTATLRFRVDGAPWEFIGRARCGFSASMESGSNSFCGPFIEFDLVVREPDEPRTVRQWISQAGDGRGAANAIFDTSVVVFNPASASRELLLSLWPDTWGGQTVLQEIPEMLGPRQMVERKMTDFFGGWGFDRFGLLQSDLTIVEPVGEPDPMIQATIFATNQDGRQFGQYFQGGAAGNALHAGETALLFTTHEPQRYRVNVGIVSMEDGTQVVLTPRGPGGQALADPVLFRPNFFGITEQYNNIYALWDLAGHRNVMVEAEVESGAAFVYGSALDGRWQIPGTSDPTTILPVTRGSDRVVLLELGRITGINEFSGSASVYNHGSQPIDVRVDFYERGVPGTSASSSLTIGGMETLGWDDAVGELVGRSGVTGSLVLTVEDGQPGSAGISAVGREFAIYRDGDEILGTAGQAMPGLVDTDMLVPGETFHFIGLRDRELDAGPERSHLGLLNLGPADAVVKVSGFADERTPEGTTWVSVRAGEQTRVNRIMRAIKPEQDGGLKRIEVTTTVPVHALAYKVNSNGDPVTLLPFRR